MFDSARFISLSELPKNIGAMLIYARLRPLKYMQNGIDRNIVFWLWVYVDVHAQTSERCIHCLISDLPGVRLNVLRKVNVVA